MFRLVVSKQGVIRLLLGVIVTAAALSVAPRVLAQAVPSFEVASIRPVTGSQGQSVLFLPTGRFTALNLTLRDLIALAYGPARQPLPTARVIGGPDWIASQRFNVEAIAAGPVASDPAFDGFPGAMFGMLQSLLADRFQLVVRRETRDTPVYVLVKTRTDGRLGPRMRESANGCSKRPAPGATAPPGVTIACEMEFTRGRIAAQGMSMQALTATLQRYVDRLLFDETGLSGDFNANLEWSPEVLTVENPSPASGASIFTAAQEQLGLRLESRRAPVEVVIVERAEQPTAN
jgi:uncharacterized protein (TIGR03435 family)